MSLLGMLEMTLRVGISTGNVSKDWLAEPVENVFEMWLSCGPNMTVG